MSLRTALTRLAAAVAASALAVGSAFGLAVAFTAPARAQPTAEVIVIGSKCDGHSNVIAVRMIVPAPGVVELSWDPKVVCGLPT